VAALGIARVLGSADHRRDLDGISGAAERTWSASGRREGKATDSAKRAVAVSFVLTVAQPIAVDLVFSLD